MPPSPRGVVGPHELTTIVDTPHYSPTNSWLDFPSIGRVSSSYQGAPDSDTEVAICGGRGNSWIQQGGAQIQPP